MTGLLLVDKPAGMTSHDVVDVIRKAAKMRRVGHTGTLDPAATGLLVLCLGLATRLSEHITKSAKTYEGVMRLGVTTDSYDLDGKVEAESPVPSLTAEDIQHVCNDFSGEIEQIPPMVSAVKVGGVRLYKKARKGEIVERAPRRVLVDEFSVLSYEAPDARVRVRCGSGTYVRSLCHDVGQRLGCGAVLAQLRRTQIGRHSVEDALPLAELNSPDVVRGRLIPMGQALDCPRLVVTAAGRGVVAMGNLLLPSHAVGDQAAIPEGLCQILDESGLLIALGQALPSAAGLRVQPKRVFIAEMAEAKRG